MALQLSRDQQQVVNEILRVARRRRENPMDVKAAFATGLVESNLRNLPGGDADSQGWRQERASLYRNPRNLTASVNRFFNETDAVAGRYGNAGDLAAAVQRPAAQYRGRYAQRSREADELLKLYTAGGRGGATSRRRAAPGRGGPSTAAAGTTPDGQGQALAGLLLAQSLEGGRQRPQSVGLQTPGFAAGPALPSGAMSVQSAGPRQAPGDALSQALTAAASLGDGTELPPRDEPESGVRTPQGGRSGGARPRAIRPGGGYAGSQGVAQSLARIGHDLGLKTMSTKRHNQNPHSGDRSDHDHGNKDAYAYDISNGGAPTPEMDRTAYRIMRQLGFKNYRMGQPIDTSRGVRTIRTDKGTYRVQVIYRGTGAAFGGNHLNHVHIGVKRIG